MATTDKNRRDLFNHLEEALGTDPAHTLMELLPLEPSNELVTRSDMHAFGTEVSSEMAELRAELRGEMSELRAELRGEMSELRAELRGEMSDLRAGIRGDMAELRGEFRALEGRFDSKFAELQVNTQRLFAGAIAANVIAVVTALAT